MAQILESASIPAVISKEECIYCFHSPYNDATLNDLTHPPHNSLDVCLHCFQAVCHRHLGLHYQVALNATGSTHSGYLNLAKVKRSDTRDEQDTRNKKIKLRVVEKSEDEIYETLWILGQFDESTLSLKASHTSNDSNIPGSISSKVKQILDSKSQDMVDQTSSWELTVKPCPHVKTFRPPMFESVKQANSSCTDCGLPENLWLCLHCGNVGCGRNQVGVEGHSHALKHFESNPSHSIAVKLGSLSKSSSDLYCYSCDDETNFEDQRPFIEALKSYGINLEDKMASEKTLVELQVEQNMNWDFQMTDSEGKHLLKLEPDQGRGCGLINLGNSCYLNSVLQCLFNGGVKGWSLNELGHDFPQDVVFPTNNLRCQLIKLNNAMKLEPQIYSGGIRPKSFKRCIGQTHEEFSSGRQQDAMEFLGYLVDVLDKNIFKNSANPNDLMKFVMEDRLQCSKCTKVKYSQETAESLQLPLPENDDPQDLVHIISRYFHGEEVEFTCPYCKIPVKAIKRPAFNSYPDTLVVNPARIRPVNWVPVKTSNELTLPGLEDSNKTLDISPFSSTGYDPTQEELIPEDEQAIGFVPNQTAASQLAEMGFQPNGIARALFSTGNSDVESAMNWLFQHVEDSDLNEPFIPPKDFRSSGKAQFNPELLANMTAMGLDEKLSFKALILNKGDVNRSVEWVFNNMDDDGELPQEPSGQNLKDYGHKNAAFYELTGVICHKGNSVHSGHYVTFIRQIVNNEKNWVLYNDEKIVVATPENFEEMKKNGYIYLYSRR